MNEFVEKSLSKYQEKFQAKLILEEFKSKFVKEPRRTSERIPGEIYEGISEIIPVGAMEKSLKEFLKKSLKKSWRNIRRIPKGILSEVPRRVPGETP